jgi:HlyD family secretion protein
MEKRKLVVIITILAHAVAGIAYWFSHQPRSIMLTGIVDTEERRVNSQIQGRIDKLLVQQGDTVKKGQLVALIQPQELAADKAFFENSARASAAEVEQAKANLSFLEAQTRNQISQAEANLAMYKAQVVQAQADREYSELRFRRAKELRDINSKQDYEQASTSYDAARARVESLQKQVESAAAAVQLAKANADQIDARKAALKASNQQLAAARAQTEKADVLLGYTRLSSPIDGIVDVRAALQGEVVTPGQTVVTLVNPDNLWVRADVEESYIDRIRIGDKMTVRLPSGGTREGTVFYRGVDADYATQRDVSRTKRDIKTFEVRLRCDNKDRCLALGMTTYVLLPLR